MVVAAVELNPKNRLAYCQNMFKSRMEMYVHIFAYARKVLFHGNASPFRDAGERGTPPSPVHRHLLDLGKLHCFLQIAQIGDRQFPRSLHRSAIADRAQNRLRCGERRGREGQVWTLHTGR